MSKQLVKSRFDSRIFFRGPRNQLPTQEESALEQLRTFSRWLLVVPLVLTLIFSIGQLAMHLNAGIQLTRTNSSLSAEYSPWEFVPVRALRDDIIYEIQYDLAMNALNSASFQKPIQNFEHEWLEELSNPTDLDRMP